MQISQTTATQIIAEINKIIPYKINIMDPTGLIIASSDIGRMNQIHTGARQLIEQNLTELRVFENEEYDGGKQGTNFPIVVRDKVVGVIGITGVYEEICSYAQIIKRLSEILLLDDVLKREQMQQTYKINSFIYEWIHTKSTLQEKELRERGALLGIDIHHKRRFIYMKPQNTTNEEMMCKVEQCIRQNRFGDYDFFVLRMSTSLFIGVQYCGDREIVQWLHQLEKSITMILSYPIYIGVDIKSEESNVVYEHYMQAKRAMRACRSQEKMIVLYKDVSMDLFLEEISDKTKQEFIEKIFKAYNNQELKQTIELLECYYRSNGSIQQSSQALYLHKNTLQNRLKRIKEKTGYDPRALRDVPLFSIAIQFYRYQEVKL